jgi:hypothetical protein
LTDKRNENMSLSRFCEAHLQIQRLAGKVGDGCEPTEQDMENGLRDSTTGAQTTAQEATTVSRPAVVTTFSTASAAVC